MRVSPDESDRVCTRCVEVGSRARGWGARACVRLSALDGEDAGDLWKPSKRRAALLYRAKRLEDLAVQVMTAIGERDAAVAPAEQRAGNALREVTTVAGVRLP